MPGLPRTLSGPCCAACGQKALADEDRRFRHLVGRFVQSMADSTRVCGARTPGVSKPLVSCGV